jgi:hypothetical protein
MGKSSQDILHISKTVSSIFQRCKQQYELLCNLLKSRGWCIKFATGLNNRIGIVQKVKTVLLPKCSRNGRIILAKGQFDHTYTF